MPLAQLEGVGVLLHTTLSYQADYHHAAKPSCIHKLLSHHCRKSGTGESGTAFSLPQTASNTGHISHLIAKTSCMAPRNCKGARKYGRETELHRLWLIRHEVKITEVHLVTPYFPLVICLRPWQSLRGPSRVVLSAIMVLTLSLDFHM